MAAIVLFVLALIAAGVGVVTGLAPGGTTPDDELVVLFSVLTSAVLLSAGVIVTAIEGVRKAIEAARSSGASP